MHKIISLSFIILFIISSCKEKEPKDDPSMMVGNDKDSHGCIGSAGYQWSELLQDCIRSFELPLKLLSGNKEQMAGVAFSKDLSKAEIFYSEGTLLLSRKSNSEYIPEKPESPFRLQKEKGKWIFRGFPDKSQDYREE